MSHIEKILGCGGRIINERMSGSDCWWFEYRGLRDTISNAQDIALELRRLVLGVWNYVKNSRKFDADNCTLEWVGNLPGKRESRRMVTEYMLTEHDVRAQRVFSDTAFYGGWYLDHARTSSRSASRLSRPLHCSLSRGRMRSGRCQAA